MATITESGFGIKRTYTVPDALCAMCGRPSGHPQSYDEYGGPEATYCDDCYGQFLSGETQDTPAGD